MASKKRPAQPEKPKIDVAGALKTGSDRAVAGSGFEVGPWQADCRADVPVEWRCIVFAVGVGPPPRTSVQRAVAIDAGQLGSMDEVAIANRAEQDVRAAMQSAAQGLGERVSW